MLEFGNCAQQFSSDSLAAQRNLGELFGWACFQIQIPTEGLDILSYDAELHTLMQCARCGLVQLLRFRYEDEAERDELDDVACKTNGGKTFCHSESDLSG